MAIGRSEDWDNPWDAMVLLRHHCRVWDPIRAPHLGQRPSVPHTKAGHMTAIDQNVIFALQALRDGGRPHMRPGEGRLTEPITAVQTWRPELVLMPHRRH